MYKQHVSPYLEEKTSPLASQKGHQDVWHGEACRLGRKCCCWSLSGVPVPERIFPCEVPIFQESGPRNPCFFFFFRKQPALVLKNWRWGVFHCGHHDFWCGRRDQTGAVCNVTECFVGSQQYHLGGNFYHGMDGWDVLLTFVCCCKFEGWISSLVLFTIGDIKRGIP